LAALAERIRPHLAGPRTHRSAGLRSLACSHQQADCDDDRALGPWPVLIRERGSLLGAPNLGIWSTGQSEWRTDRGRHFPARLRQQITSALEMALDASAVLEHHRPVGLSGSALMNAYPFKCFGWRWVGWAFALPIVQPTKFEFASIPPKRSASPSQKRYWPPPTR
jgi:hypothetical protein